MGNEAHIRIDEGVKRGPRVKIKPADLERNARDEAGKFLTVYTPELKERAITDALIALEAGARVETIADRHGVPRSTMYSWIIGDERAQKLRTQFFDGQAARNLCEIRAAPSPLDLARARHELDGWIKVAERRDPKSWAPKQELSIEITGDLGDRLRRARERVIEGEVVKTVAVQHEAQVIDSDSDAVQHVETDGK